MCVNPQLNSPPIEELILLKVLVWLIPTAHNPKYSAEYSFTGCLAAANFLSVAVECQSREHRKQSKLDCAIS